MRAAARDVRSPKVVLGHSWRNLGAWHLLSIASEEKKSREISSLASPTCSSTLPQPSLSLHLFLIFFSLSSILGHYSSSLSSHRPILYLIRPQKLQCLLSFPLPFTGSRSRPTGFALKATPACPPLYVAVLLPDCTLHAHSTLVPNYNGCPRSY